MCACMSVVLGDTHGIERVNLVLGTLSIKMNCTCISLSLSLMYVCIWQDILFIVLVAEGMLVTYAAPKEHALTPMGQLYTIPPVVIWRVWGLYCLLPSTLTSTADIHLILNLVHASTSFR